MSQSSREPTGEGTSVWARWCGWLCRIDRGLLLKLGAVGAALLLAAAAGALAQKAGVLGRVAAKASRAWDVVVERAGWREIPDVRNVTREDLKSGLIDLEKYTIPLGPFDGLGGSIVEYGKGIVFVEPKGQLGYVSFDGEIKYLKQRVPMNLEGMLSWLDKSQQAVSTRYFRTLDSLIVTEPSGAQWLFVSHNRFKPNCVEFVVSRIGISLGADGPLFADDGWQELFVAKPCVPLPPDAAVYAGHEGGGRLVAAGPGRLLVSVGYFAFDGVHLSPPVSQDPNVNLGKIVELNYEARTARNYAQGVRNPQGLTIDSKGRIWETEHGPMGGDELNIIREGRDYGWPATTYGMNYGNKREDWPGNRRQGWHDESFELPRFFFNPSIGISEVIEVQGDEFGLWQGDLLIASMTGRTLYRARLRGDEVVSIEPIVLGARLRDMIRLSDSRVALLTDDGEIFLLQRHREPGEPAGVNVAKAFRGFAAITAARKSDTTLGRDIDFTEQGRRLFVNYCSSCHSLDGKAGMGPSLRGVIGREVASTDFNYSPALRAAKGHWTWDRLYAFILDPQAAAPGSAMPKTPLTYYDIEQILNYVAKQGS